MTHFIALKLRFQRTLHDVKRFISCCRAKQSPKSVICFKHFVSSANIYRREEETEDGKSFTKIKNRIGPRILPCGTPEMTDKVFETHAVIE